MTSLAAPNPAPAWFLLQGAVIFISSNASMAQGHYISVVQQHAAGGVRWLRCDDAIVEIITVDHAFALMRRAYMLFYKVSDQGLIIG